MTRTGRIVDQLSLPSADAPEAAVAIPVIRVVIPCSKGKVTSQRTATRSDLDQIGANRDERFAAPAMPARDLYTGRSYLRAVAAVDEFAQRRPDLPIGLHIVSAGYGIVDSPQPLVPYEAVMGSSVSQWSARGEILRIPQRMTSLIESCDLTIIALSQPYFVAAAVAAIQPTEGCGVVIGVGPPPRSARLRVVHASRLQARGFGVSEREVASFVLGRLLARIAAEGIEVADQLPADPLEWQAL